MGSKRLRLILLGCLGFAAVAFIAIAVLGLSMLSSQSQKMVSLKLKSNVLDYQLSSLAGAKKQIQQYSYVKNVATEIIPNDKDQAQAVLDIFQLANQAGFNISNIGFPASTLGAAGAGAASTNPNAVISQAKPVDAVKGLYSIQLTITPQTGNGVPDSQVVTYPKLLSFLDNLELNERTAQITQIVISQPSASSGTEPSSAIDFSLTLNIFIKP
jgi:hypothetical protein